MTIDGKKELYWLDSRTNAVNDFNFLESKFPEPPVLALFQPCRPYMIDTDEFAYALRAVFLQQQIDSNLNEWSTIGYWSRTRNQGEQSYLATKRKRFAVAWAIQP